MEGLDRKPKPSSVMYKLAVVCFIAVPVFVVAATMMYGTGNASGFDVFAIKVKNFIWNNDAERQQEAIVGGRSREITATYNGAMLTLPPSLTPSASPPLKSTFPLPAQAPAPSPITKFSEDGGSFRPTTTTSISNDKLLGGLLYQGFDEASCLSRYQYNSQKRPSSHRPSPYLIHKLRAYEHLHQRCGPYSPSYNRTIRNLLNPGHGIDPSKRMLCKYLVWSPVNGLGNRIMSLVAAFLYALLTDRVLLVEFREDMMGLFCEPFPNSSWISPKDFPHKHRHQHLPTLETFMSEANGTRLPRFLFLDLGFTAFQQGSSFHCDREQSLLSRIPVLFLESDQYMVPALFMVSSTSTSELYKMFPEKDTVFYHLARYLLHPADEPWGLISRFYEAYLAKADERTGLQVRVFAADRTPAQTVMDQILACNEKHQVLPRLVRDYHHHHDATKLGKPRPSSGTILKAVLVASLSSYYSENLTTTYLTTPTAKGDAVGVYQASYEGRQKHGDNSHNMKALVDMYLLSMCDVLVTSGESTFGYVAQGLGGLKPWILEKTVGPVARDPPCTRAVSMEPCFHFPPNYDCNKKRNVEGLVSSVFPYMVPCEDRDSGVKLVNH